MNAQGCSPAVLGFDPGVEGGLAVIGADGAVIFCRGFNRKMSENEALLVAWEGADALFRAGGWKGYAEKVHHIRGDGGKGSHTFGRVNGLIRGALKTKGCILYDVPPQLWQARLECMTGGDKKVSLARALELFPGADVDKRTSDALLLALYGRLLTEQGPREGARPGYSSRASQDPPKPRPPVGP